ncbi:phage tail protein [Yersinia ruckeri]|uniref:phage tail protein n=1 Tax=Yersinia ruckeri TaxID=29486 RepID=UPI0022390F68|nr:phage tail protein [Yersinia ruckeri]
MPEFVGTTWGDSGLYALALIRRLTGKELMDFDEVMAKAAATNDATLSTYTAIELILKVMVNDNGQPMDKKYLPTADELLEAHANPDLMAAVRKVQQHSLGTLEEAEKN